MFCCVVFMYVSVCTQDHIDDSESINITDFHLHIIIFLKSVYMQVLGFSVDQFENLLDRL